MNTSKNAITSELAEGCKAAAKSALNPPEALEGQLLALVPTPGRRKAQLNTLDGIRREMARVYRQAESGTRDTSEASKLVYILSQIGKALEVIEIEARLRALEARGNVRLPAPDRAA